MNAKHNSVHVATIIRKYKGKVYKTHLLRRTYRQGNKVLHETLGNLTRLPETTIDLIRRSLKGEEFVAPRTPSVRCTPCLMATSRPSCG